MYSITVAGLLAKKSLPSLILLCFLIGHSGCTPVDKAEASSRSIMYVVGDLHGDLSAARAALALTGATNSAGEWVGQNLTVIQTGDLIDRGPEDRKVLDWLAQLEKQAANFNSNLHLLNGNHELMNVDGDFRYIHPDSMQAFSDLANAERSKALHLENAPTALQGRANAFLPGGLYAQQLQKRPIVLQLNDTLFVHGGLLPAHADYGLAAINQAYAEHIAQGTPLPQLLQDGENGPLWTRIYSLPDQAADCSQLTQVLQTLKAKRMVVAHSVQPHINSACEGKVWRIDTGMSKAYQGVIEVLKIEGNTVSVLHQRNP
jgi:hypothetical protein